MFTLKSRAEIVARTLLIAVILFNALVPTALAAEAKQTSVPQLNGRTLRIEQENSSIPAFERPEPRVGDQNSDLLSSHANSDSQSNKAISNNIASPMMFIENVGQFDHRALFVARGPNTNLYLSEKEIWFTVLEKKEKPNEHPLHGQFDQLEKIKVVSLKLIFPGSNSHPGIEPFEPSNTQVSHLIGNNASQHFSDVPVWGGVRYTELYPGADLELTSENGEFVWQIVVTDSVRFSQDNQVRNHGVSIKVAGQTQLDLLGSKIKISTDVGDYILPEVQITGTIDENVFVTTPKVDRDELFLIYPRSLSLDPNQAFAKLTSFGSPSPNFLEQTQTGSSSNLLMAVSFGGGWEDIGEGVALGPDGSIFVTGLTGSTDFPTTTGAYDEDLSGWDGFVVKLDATDGHIPYTVTNCAF